MNAFGPSPRRIALINRAILSALFVGATVLMSGCRPKQTPPPPPQAPQPAMKPAPATPIEEKKEELGGKTWDPQWDVVVESALPADLLSATAARAVRSYCPNFGREAEADKRAFWAYLFQALAGAEAGLDSVADVHHTEAAVDKTDSVTGRPIRQQGLLQLSYQDAEHYGCDMDWDADKKLGHHNPESSILQPENNLMCGVKIMENQIITQHKPLLSRTSYWATLQPGTASYRVFAKQMVNVPVACRVPEAGHRRSAPHIATEAASAPAAAAVPAPR